jgi:hypothetical protein
MGHISRGHTMTAITPALQLALNSALSERATIRSRQSFMTGSIDAKRPEAWCAYGYPDNLCFADYYKLWEREGVAHGAVMRLNEKCWETDPEVIQGDPETKAAAPTAWEKQFKSIAKRLKLWEKFRDADMRRLVGYYSGVILQVADNKEWDQPLGRVSEKQLINLVPAWEGQLKVNEWYDDPKSANFGQPKAYQYTENAVEDGSNQTAQNGRMFNIHPDRVVILGDIRTGIPFLRAGYNACINLEKIVGGSGESFLKNSSRQLGINFDKDTNLENIARAHGVPVSDLQEVFDEVTSGVNKGIDQTIITQGAQVQALVANVPDPEPHFSVALQTFAASVRIPTKILVGHLTGERASTEDNKDFNKTGQGRRVNVLSADIEAFVARLIKHGMLLAVESSVIWDNLAEPSLEEKLANVQKMVDANQKMLGAGEMVFTVDEMREVAGYDAIAPIEPMGEELPEEEEEVRPDPLAKQ